MLPQDPGQPLGQQSYLEIKDLTRRISRLETTAVSQMDGYFLWDVIEDGESKSAKARIGRYEAKAGSANELQQIKALYADGLRGKTARIMDRDTAAVLSLEGRLLLISMFGRARLEGKIPNDQVGDEFYLRVCQGLGFDDVSAAQPRTFRDPKSGEYYSLISSSLLKTHKKNKDDARRVAQALIPEHESGSFLSIASPNTAGWLDLAIADSNDLHQTFALSRESRGSELSTALLSNGKSAWVFASDRDMAQVVSEPVQEQRTREQIIKEKLNSDPDPLFPVSDVIITTDERERVAREHLRNSKPAQRFKAYGEQVRDRVRDYVDSHWLSSKDRGDKEGFFPDFLERLSSEPELIATNIDATGSMPLKTSFGMGINGGGLYMRQTTDIASSRLETKFENDPIRKESILRSCYFHPDDGNAPVKYCYLRNVEDGKGNQFLQLETEERTSTAFFRFTGGVKVEEVQADAFRIGHSENATGILDGYLSREINASTLPGKTMAFTRVAMNVSPRGSGQSTGDFEAGSKTCLKQTSCFEMGYTYRKYSDQPLEQTRRLYFSYTNRW